MKSIGRVQTISHTGKIIAQGGHAPRPGSKVYDNSKGRVGTVVKVFGPMKAPYVAIRPDKKKTDLLSLIDMELYTEG